MSLDFKIELTGNFAGALEKSSKALGETTKHTSEAEKAMGLFEVELGKVHSGLLSLDFNALKEGGNFFVFDLAKGAEIAYESIKRVVDGVIDLGKEMIETAAAAEDLNLAIKLDVGEEGEKQVDRLAESFSNSAFSPRQIKDALLPILEESGNEHKDQWDDLATAATDVATRRNTGVAGAKEALQALNEIELNPQRLRGSLKSLGIKQLEFYKDLGDLLGVSEKTAEAQTKAGKVKAQTLLSVALHQIAQREGGVLGRATNEGSNTLGASLKRLENLKETLFDRLAGSKGMKAIQGVIDKFVELTSSSLGDRFLAGADETFARVAGWIDKITSPEGIDSIVDGFNKALEVVKAIGSTLEVIVKAVSGVAEAIRTIGEFAAEEDERQRAGTVGKRQLSGGWALKLDQKDRQKALDAAGKGGFFHRLFTSDTELTNEAFRQLRGASDVRGRLSQKQLSELPDTKMLPPGQGPVSNDVWQGVPKMARGGFVDRPTLALVGEAGPEAIVPLGKTGSLGAQVSYAPVFHVASRQEAEEMEARGRIQFKRLLEEIGLASGVG